MRRVKNYLSLTLVIIMIAASFIYKNKSENTMGSINKSPIYSVDRQDNTIAFTFDINWTEKDNIYSILDVLDRYNVKGTFFIIGKWVDYSEENQKKLKLICERGHEIGNHSYNHPLFSKMGEDKIKEELRKTNETIERVTGEKPEIFRFPSGDYTEKSIEIVATEGYIPVQWDVDSVDWKEVGADVEYNRVLKGVKSGSIILFHNNGKYTPGNLEKLLSELGDKGYKFVTVGQLIYQRNYKIDQEGKQIKK